MKEILYHGSTDIIQKPEFGKGKKTNDYGRGFYCTSDIELAREWACGSGSNGYANRYELEYDDLNILYLNSPEYTILNWLALLARNRTYWQNGAISAEAKNYLQQNFLIDITPFDVVIGYRADDSYFSFAQDFVAGAISLRKLSEAMQLGKLGEQVVLISPKAFERIRYMDSEPVTATIYYDKKCLRDQEARKEYRRTKAETSSVQDIYMLDIMRAEMKNADIKRILDGGAWDDSRI